MRNMLILAVLGFIGHSYFNGTLRLALFSHNTPTPVIHNAHGIITIEHAHSTPPHQSSSSPTSAYGCDGRQYCSQMRSYDEAVFFLNNCPNTKMDGNRDGIPCQQQFGR